MTTLNFEVSQPFSAIFRRKVTGRKAVHSSNITNVTFFPRIQRRAVYHITEIAPFTCTIKQKLLWPHKVKYR
jgi:hypothetical protein